MLRPFRTDGAGKRRLERPAPDPVMAAKETKEVRKPPEPRLLVTPGRLRVRHDVILTHHFHSVFYLEGPVGIGPTLTGPQPAVPPQHFGPVGVRGNAPRFAPYQEAGLLLTYTPFQIGAVSRI